jgi:hypothetical protein
MDKSEIKQDRTIDPSQLDVEAACQADLFFKWAERSVEARAEVDRAKLRLSITEARLQMECRKSPENFDLARVTEPAIGAAVKASKKYRETSDALIRAHETSAMIDQAVKALDIKKRMIEVLITLHGQQYFAGPSVPRDLVAAWRERNEKIETVVKKKQVGKARPRKRKKRKTDA